MKKKEDYVGIQKELLVSFSIVCCLIIIKNVNFGVNCAGFNANQNSLVGCILALLSHFRFLDI